MESGWPTFSIAPGATVGNLQGTNLADKPQDGAMYAPNITLLIPRYSDADLEKLLRHGVPRDGRQFWFMPVESFQFLSDRDLAAIVAYLRTFKPAGQALPPFKFNSVEQKDVDTGVLGNASIPRSPSIKRTGQSTWARSIPGAAIWSRPHAPPATTTRFRAGRISRPTLISPEPIRSRS